MVLPNSSGDRCALLTVDYDLDLVSVVRLRQELGSFAAHTLTKLIIDLSPCTFVDTAGIAGLAFAYRRSVDEEFRLAMVVPSRLMSWFAILGLTQIFEIFPTLASAEAAGMAR